MIRRPGLTVLGRSRQERPWGRSNLPDVGGTGSRLIGEVWHQNFGQTLPVLVKSIYTSERLSVQVHPDDAAARRAGLASGKEEWWLVTAAAPGATLGIGLKRPMSREALRASLHDGSIIDLMEWFPAKAGDYFHIPPGTVHAIGPGLDIVEVQQNADITYRLYDYGRGRKLHLDEGIAVSQPIPHPSSLRGSLGWQGHAHNSPQKLSACAHFCIWKIDQGSCADLPDGDYQIVPLTGSAAFDGGIAECGAVLWGDPSLLHALSPDFTALAIASLVPVPFS